MMLADRWGTRDGVVLEAVVELCDADPYPMVNLGTIADKTGLPIMEVGTAARALDEAGLIELHVTMSGGDPSPWIITGISAQARRLTGVWPTEETVAQRLLDAMEAQLAAETDAAKKSWLSKVLSGAGDVSRATAVDVLSQIAVRFVTRGVMP